MAVKMITDNRTCHGKSWLRNVLRIVGLSCICCFVGNGGVGASGATDVACCTGCQTSTNECTPPDPENGKPKNQPQGQCVPIGLDGQTPPSKSYPPPPPDVHSLAYCVLEFLNGPNRCYADMVPDYPVNMGSWQHLMDIHWGSRISLYGQPTGYDGMDHDYLYNGELRTNGSRNGVSIDAEGYDPVLWGRDGSYWVFDDIFPDPIPGVPHFLNGVFITWSPYVDRFEEPPTPDVTLEYGVWDGDTVVVPEDPADTRLCTISDGVVTYTFAYQGGGGGGGDVNADDVSTAIESVNGSDYAKIEYTYSTETNEDKGEIEGKRSGAAYSMKVGGAWVEVGEERYTWHTGETQTGKPHCTFAEPAQQLISAHIPGDSHPDESSITGYANSCLEYDDDGKIKTVIGDPIDRRTYPKLPVRASYIRPDGVTVMGMDGSYGPPPIRMGTGVSSGCCGN